MPRYSAIIQLEHLHSSLTCYDLNEHTEIWLTKNRLNAIQSEYNDEHTVLRFSFCNNNTHLLFYAWRIVENS